MLTGEGVCWRLIPSHRLVKIAAHLLTPDLLKEVFLNNRTLELLLLFLRSIARRINQVLILTDHVQVSLTVLIEDYVLLEVDQSLLLLFTLTAGRCLARSDRFVDEVGHLLALISLNCLKQSRCLLNPGPLDQLGIEEACLNLLPEAVHVSREGIEHADTAAVVYFHS